MVVARRSWILLVLISLTGCVGPPPLAVRHLQKSVWVTRFDYKTRGDIERIMASCAAAGFGSVMFQVRGNATTLYGSHHEIWSEQFGFKGPGFDPLSHAVQAAHHKGLRLHAWVNALPGWRGEKPPSDPRQLFRARPEWFLRTADGKLPDEGGSYAWLNPCLPEVRLYIANLCEEIASGYRVDGIHLDYVRFPAGRDSEQSPGDPRSLALFGRSAGRPPAAMSPAERANFRAWKAGCVTDLVRRVRQRLARLPRRVTLTTAVSSNLARIRKDVLQDWPRWAREGWVDAVFPMNYTEKGDVFLARARACVAAAAGTPVVMGIGVYKHQEQRLPPRATVRQMRAALQAGAVGVCLFSYGSTQRGAWAPAIARWSVAPR